MPGLKESEMLWGPWKWLKMLKKSLTKRFLAISSGARESLRLEFVELKDL